MTRTDAWKNPAQWRALVILTGVFLLLFKTSNLSGTGDWPYFYIAARRFRLGLNPYKPGMLPKGYPFGFAYPPLGLWLLVGTTYFSLNTSMRIWDVLCAELYAITIYLWFEMIWSRVPSFREFSLAAASCTAACTFIAFAAHHLILPVLFFVTAAFYFLVYKKKDFSGGLWTGAMLLKPHLMVLPAVLLFRKARSKLLFSAGVLFVILCSLAPFMNLHRPLTDLSDMVKRREASIVVYKDEQGLGAILLQALFYRTLSKQVISQSAAGFYDVTSRAIFQYSKIKYLITALGLLLWVIYLRRLPVLKQPDTYIWTVTAGLLTAMYSHNYDSVLVVPLILLTVHRLNRFYDLSTIACYGIIIHLATTYILSVVCFPDGVYWPWLSVATVCVCGLLLYVTPEIRPRSR